MKYLLMVVLLCTVTQARAVDDSAFLTANELLVKCEAYINDTNISMGNVCAGYIEGVNDTYSAFNLFKDLNTKWFCTPDNVQISQLVRVVTKHLQENPKILHELASAWVILALNEAFPCE